MQQRNTCECHGAEVCPAQGSGAVDLIASHRPELLRELAEQVRKCMDAGISPELKLEYARIIGNLVTPDPEHGVQRLVNFVSAVERTPGPAHIWYTRAAACVSDYLRRCRVLS